MNVEQTKEKMDKMKFYGMLRVYCTFLDTGQGELTLDELIAALQEERKTTPGDHPVVWYGDEGIAGVEEVGLCMDRHEVYLDDGKG